MARIRRVRLRPGWWLLASAAAWGWMGWRIVQRRLTPANPTQAAQLGHSLTRAGRRVMAVTAHPDDLELFIGGTLRLLSLAGGRITVVVATGGDQQYAEQRTLNQIREQEQRDAGTILGYDDIRFLGYSDLNLAHNPEFEDRLKREWDLVRPDVVFAFDPTAPYRSAVHPDHLAVGRTVLNIARRMGPDAPEVVFYGSKDPNVLVDVSQVVEDKTEAIRCHRSELHGWKRLYNLATRFQARMAGRAADMRYAEPLRYLSLPPLRQEAFEEKWSAPEPELHH